MLFFETTPLGTILNRFSRDVDTIDVSLPRVFSGFFRTFAGVVGKSHSSLSCSARTNLEIECLRYGRCHLIFGSRFPPHPRSRPSRLSPHPDLLPCDFSRTQATRCYYQESNLRLVPGDSRRCVDHSCIPTEPTLHRRERSSTRPKSGSFLPFDQLYISLALPQLISSETDSCVALTGNRWLAVRLEFLGSIIILSTAVLAVTTLVRTNSVNAGIVGLMLSYALSTTQTLNWIVRSATEVETKYVDSSTERTSNPLTLSVTALSRSNVYKSTSRSLLKLPSRSPRSNLLLNGLNLVASSSSTSPLVTAKAWISS